MASRYFLESIARHGAAATRLIEERENKQGEFSDCELRDAIGFDAADFAWAVLALSGYESVQESRFIRNKIAEAIIAILNEHSDSLGPVWE